MLTPNRRSRRPPDRHGFSSKASPKKPKSKTKKKLQKPPPQKEPPQKQPSVLQMRRERSKQKQRKPQKRPSGGAVVVVSQEEESYYEVEKIVGRRRGKQSVEYLVRWKGCPPSQDTWEPAQNLCDTAFAMAVKYTRAETARKKLFEQNEERLLMQIEPPATAVDNTIMDEDAPTPPAADEHWSWTDDELITTREIERISVHSPDARQRVTEARLHGIPICLVGHVGWPQFCKSWLQPQQATNHDDDWIDLSKPHTVHVPSMMHEIGSEAVPVVRHNYDEQNPIHDEILASTFLSKFWKQDDDTQGPSLYLHQWQFPLSLTASERFCGDKHVNPLPNDILGEDLLRFWLDPQKCNQDSPFQYLFMGQKNTMSKLHADNGGLAILIAPIVGEKEVVLVHRNDGASCLYHLEADLNRPNLQDYPLLPHARVWKSIVRPGEILLMPQGTFHQCRNVTACLSYSRFYLDTINLKPFLESYFDGDAPEIEHTEVLWNATTELRDQLDTFSEYSRTQVLGGLPAPPLTPRIVKTVDTLRALRNTCQEVVLRLQKSNTNNQAKEARRQEQWDRFVEDLDITLHDFRYRHSDPKPRFKSRRKKRTPVETTEAAARAPTQKRTNDIHTSFLALPDLSPTETHFTIPDSVSIGLNANVVVRCHGKRVKGVVLAIEDQMEAAYLTYEGYSQFYDEYQPFDRLRRCGESSLPFRCGDLREGLKVINRWGGKGEEYNGTVLSTRCATFYKVRLSLQGNDVERWLVREQFIDLQQEEQAGGTPDLAAPPTAFAIAASNPEQVEDSSPVSPAESE